MVDTETVNVGDEFMHNRDKYDGVEWARFGGDDRSLNPDPVEASSKNENRI